MTRINNLVAVFTVLVVALSPIPFGSNRPFFWAVSGILVAAISVFYFLNAARSREDLRVSLYRIRFIAFLWLAVSVWLVIQVIPFGLFVAPFTVNLAGGEVITTNTISTAPGATLLMLIRIVSYGLFFVLALQAGAKDTRSSTMLMAIFWIIVGHAGFALLQLTQFGDTILGLPKNSYLGVATGTFINRNSFATFLAIGLSVGVALLPELITRKLARNQSSVDRAFVVMVYLGGLFLIMVTLLATQSRMGLFAGVAGAFFVLLLVLKQHRLWKVLVPAAIVGALALIVVTTWTFGQGVLERVIGLESAGDTRGELYAQVWEQILTRPLLGFGGGAFSLFFPAYFGPPLTLNVFWDKAHSTYLALFSELGLVAGTLPILAVLVIFARTLWSQIASGRLSAARLASIGAMITVALHSLVDFSVEIQANSFLFAAVAALGLAASFRRKEA